MSSSQNGFTLVELITGIVIIAIALTLMSTLIIPQAKLSVEPLQEMRAATLAQMLMNEIAGKAYDEQSNHNDDNWRCGETLTDLTVPACTDESSYGPDSGETRATYNDVDDYDTSGSFITPARADGTTLEELYPNFTVRITVSSDPSLIAGSGNNIAKRVDIEIKLPNDETITFSRYRWNF